MLSQQTAGRDSEGHIRGRDKNQMKEEEVKDARVKRRKKENRDWRRKYVQ